MTRGPCNAIRELADLDLANFKWGMCLVVVAHQRAEGDNVKIRVVGVGVAALILLKEGGND